MFGCIQFTWTLLCADAHAMMRMNLYRCICACLQPRSQTPGYPTHEEEEEEEEEEDEEGEEEREKGKEEDEERVENVV